jgi:signal transduction histidine kinase
VLPVGRGLVGSVVTSGVPRRIDDVRRAGDLLPEARGPVADDGIRAIVCVPVRARQTVLGTLSLGRQAATAFSDDEVALLQCVADQIGLALEHARLHAETRRQLQDLERAQTAVVRAERLSAVGELTRGVAHEINNPLMIVLGQVQVLREEQPSETAQRGLEMIERAARRAAAVVRDLRQFAEPAPPLRAPCQLAEHIRRALALHAERLDADHIAWHIDLEDVPPIWADAAHVDQLLNHLIENARHAMVAGHQGGTLLIRLSSIVSGIRLEVGDDGPGIEPEHLPRIFNPFFTTKGPDGGRGLGLSVSHGIVREHGGRIWAENRAPGGALLVVELPLGLRSSEIPRA